MECEKCKKHEATIHLTEIIKDVKSELHLCEHCAKDIGLNSKLSNFSLSIPEMLSFLDISEVDGKIDRKTCSTCGRSFLDLKKDGKVGCPDCYQNLDDNLETIIHSYKKVGYHIGKHPHNEENKIIKCPTSIPVLSEETETENETLGQLYKKLEEAVLDEEYEEAAVIRDKIKEKTEAGAGID